MNSKMRAKVEADKKLRAQLGVVRYEVYKAEKKINDTAIEAAAVLVHKERDVIITETVEIMESCLAIALESRFDFDKDKINIVLSGIRSQLECITQGLITSKEIIKQCLDMGIKL